MASQYYQSLIIVDSDHQLFPFPTVGPCVGNFGIRKPLPDHSMLSVDYYTIIEHIPNTRLTKVQNKITSRLKEMWMKCLPFQFLTWSHA